MNLSIRSNAKEFLDNDDIPFPDIKRNMEELEVINRRLGGHAITIAGFKSLAKGKRELLVCEIGCGGGDNLVAIKKWCDNKRIHVTFQGVDIKEECIRFARSRQELSNCTEFHSSDYRTARLTKKPDIIFSSLFCHHFTGEELQQQFRWMHQNSRMGFFINDLHRHSLAYYSIKHLTKLFSRSYLVRNDAPLSVLRGFKKPELQALLKQAGIMGASVEWKWAFRFLIVYAHGR